MYFHSPFYIFEVMFLCSMKMKLVWWFGFTVTMHLHINLTDDVYVSLGAQLFGLDFSEHVIEEHV